MPCSSPWTMPGDGYVNKKVVDIDWEQYAALYPDRYLKPSPFDAYVQAELAARTDAEVLDIGGGAHGTAYLHQARLKCWLLDPGIRGCPSWMLGNLDWTTVGVKRFDCIVARGSFNYLTKPQIQMIPALLKPGGWFGCNTFYKPWSGTRTYQNSATGVQGSERFVYHAEAGIIEHELEPDGQDYIMKHTFFVYEIDEIIELLGTEGLRLAFLRGNSLCISLQR